MRINSAAVDYNVGLILLRNWSTDMSLFIGIIWVSYLCSLIAVSQKVRVCDWFEDNGSFLKFGIEYKVTFFDDVYFSLLAYSIDWLIRQCFTPYRQYFSHITAVAYSRKWFYLYVSLYHNSRYIIFISSNNLPLLSLKANSVVYSVGFLKIFLFTSSKIE